MNSSKAQSRSRYQFCARGSMLASLAPMSLSRYASSIVPGIAGGVSLIHQKHIKSEGPAMAHRFLIKEIALQAGVGVATVDRVQAR
jgi:hypothetical protein